MENYKNPDRTRIVSSGGRTTGGYLTRFKNLALVGLLGATALRAQSASVFDVIPNSYLNSPANGYSAALSQPIRSQQLYPASEFPAATVRITALRWRRYNSQTFSSASGQFRFKLSTTSRSENNLSSTFAQNVGPNETVVFDGTWNVSSPTPDNVAPYPFEMVLNLTTPFDYNPTEGNLLLEHQCFSTSIPFVDAAGDVGDGLARAYNLNLDPNGTTASVVDTGGEIIQFEYTIIPTFNRVATGVIVTDAGQKLTTAWTDIDSDGNIDAFIANVEGNDFLYRNLGGGSFQSLTSSPITTSGGASTAGIWGDYDNDGNVDLFVANRGQDHFLYRGLGGTSFAAVTTSAVLAGGQQTYHAAWVDYDNDGHLDLFVVNLFELSSLYHNNGNGTFTKNTAASIANGSTSWVGSAWGDFNNDGRVDVFLASANFQPDALYRNDGNGVFTSVGSGDMVSDTGGATSACWADYDNDGDLDLFVANRDGVNFLYRNNAGTSFTKITTGAIVTDAADSNAGAWGDYDNDGWQDLYVANGDTPPNQTNFLYRNNRNGTFTKVTTGTPVTDTDFSASAVWVDYDNDGDLDLFGANATGGNALYQNAGNANHWLKVRLVGSLSNKSAIGARIKVTAQINGASLTQSREVSGDGGFTSQNLEPHFGMGDASLATTVRVEWPSGIVTTIQNVSSDQTISINEVNSSFTHVIPAGLENTDGNNYSGILHESQLRLQTVYSASHFPAGAKTITELRFRRDINEPPFGSANVAITVRLSTTSRGPGQLSQTFSQNSGPDETTVFSGLWNYSSPSAVNPGIVRPFDIVLPLTTPFTYYPSVGNFLVDVKITSNTSLNWTDGANGAPSQVSRVVSLNANALSGNAGELNGDVIQIAYQGSATLAISPSAGTFTNSVQVTIQSPVNGGTIRYTTDGSNPTNTSAAYASPFTLNATTTVKARLYVNGFPASQIAAATYTRYVPPDIQFNPPGRLFTNQLSVTLVNNVGAGTTIFYTLNGSAPTAASTPYAGPINLTAAATIRARVYVGNFFVSDAFSETYSRVYCFANDGVPFAWREQHFGPGYLTDPRAAAGADPDDDGYTNLEEYTNGTAPVDGNSAPQIVLTVRAVPRLTFTTLPGRSYRIDRTTVLNPPNWQTLAPMIVATGAQTSYVDALAPDNSYYRIELIRN